VTTIVSTSQQRPDDVLGEWPDAGAEGVERAIASARAAADGWRRATAHERGAALHVAAGGLDAHADELTDLIVREVQAARRGAR
jgi:aldehyde dehydrogenase (NAD+)